MEESKFLEATKLEGEVIETALKPDSSKPTLEFPFDLNNLFSLQYSFDTLKQAIEWLAQKNDVINARLEALENVKPATPVV